MKIILIRHAEPDYENNTLTEKGFKEAKLLGEYYKDFKIDALYSSPLNRAYFTALALNKYHNLDIKIVEEFKEFSYRIKVDYLEEEKNTWDFLPFELSKEKDLFSLDNYLDHKWLKSNDIKTKYQEVINKFDEILKEHGYEYIDRYFKVNKGNKDTVVIVCHHGLMSLLLSHLLNIPYVIIAQSMLCLPTGVTTLVSEERREGIAQFRMLGYSDTTHLKINNEEEPFSGRFCENYLDKTRHD